MRAYIPALAVVLFLSATTAQALPMTYTFTGDADVTLANGTDLSGQFSLVINSDTSLVDLTSLPYSYLRDVSGLFTLGTFSDTLTDVTLVANGELSGFPANIQFFNGASNNGLGFDDPTGLAGYNLTESIAPITVSTSSLSPDSLSPTFGGSFSTTDGNTVEFTSDNSLTYQATAVPEPITLSLFGAGLAGAVAMRRRKKKA